MIKSHKQFCLKAICASALLVACCVVWKHADLASIDVVFSNEFFIIEGDAIPMGSIAFLAAGQEGNVKEISFSGQFELNQLIKRNGRTYRANHKGHLISPKFFPKIRSMEDQQYDMEYQIFALPTWRIVNRRLRKPVCLSGCLLPTKIRLDHIKYYLKISKLGGNSGDPAM